MSPFIRFIFAILIAGIVVNLAIVLLANARSERRQAQAREDEKRAFKEILDNVSGHFRRMDMIVESQHVDAHELDQALQTTLLVRQYGSTGSDQSDPRPVARIVIPGNRVSVDGLVLSFDAFFAEEAPDYRIFCDNKLAYFRRVCGEGETAPEKPPDPRFTWMRPYQVPELTRIHPSDSAPSYFETRLWNYTWDLIEGRMAAPASRPATGSATAAAEDFASTSRGGLTVRRVAPVTRVVRREHTYSAFINTDGTISLEEDFHPSIPDLFEAMLAEGKKLRQTPEPIHP